MLNTSCSHHSQIVVSREQFCNHPPHGCVASSLSAAVRTLLLIRKQWKVYASHCRNDNLIGLRRAQNYTEAILSTRLFPPSKSVRRCEWNRIGKRHKNRGPKQIDVMRHNHSSLSAKTIRTTGWFKLMFSRNRNCMGAKWFTFKIIVQIKIRRTRNHWKEKEILLILQFKKGELIQRSCVTKLLINWKK